MELVFGCRFSMFLFDISIAGRIHKVSLTLDFLNPNHCKGFYLAFELNNQSKKFAENRRSPFQYSSSYSLQQAFTLAIWDSCYNIHCREYTLHFYIQNKWFAYIWAISQKKTLNTWQKYFKTIKRKEKEHAQYPWTLNEIRARTWVKMRNLFNHFSCELILSFIWNFRNAEFLILALQIGCPIQTGRLFVYTNVHTNWSLFHWCLRWMVSEHQRSEIKH